MEDCGSALQSLECHLRTYVWLVQPCSGCKKTSNLSQSTIGIQIWPLVSKGMALTDDQKINKVRTRDIHYLICNYRFIVQSPPKDKRVRTTTAPGLCWDGKAIQSDNISFRIYYITKINK